jgi:CRISPR-associated protein Cas1
MLKRTIHISSKSYLSTKDDQLRIRVADDNEHSIPIEDIGLLEVDSPQVTMSSSLMAKLLQNGATTVVCDNTHHPVGILLPITGHSLHALRLRQQIECSIPTRKRAWKEIIKCKLVNQADALTELGIDDRPIRRRIPKVLSNDSTNQEGVAAAHYWKSLLRPFDQRRDPNGGPPNNMLNYGYAVLRACVARALVSSGLHPALGIKHSNRGNAFALADDVMEPYRPFVDRYVLPKALDNELSDELTPQMKKEILQILVCDTYWAEGRRPLFNAVQLSAASMAQTFAGDRGVPVFPRLCE